MKPFQPIIPPHVAEIILPLHPDLKQSIKAAIRAIAADLVYGEPLHRELEVLRTYRVRRFRIIYAVDHKTGAVRLMAVGHRRSIYEELTERIRKKG
jgi:mRNA interferase RelE/StbE